MSERGWVFVVARLYPPGNQTGEYIQNIPCSEKASMINSQDLSLIKPSKGAAQWYKSHGNTQSHTQSNYSSGYASSTGTNKSHNRTRNSPTRPIKPIRTKKPDDGQPAISYNKNGNGYHGTFAATSYIMEDEPVTAKASKPKLKAVSKKARSAKIVPKKVVSAPKGFYLSYCANGDLSIMSKVM